MAADDGVEVSPHNPAGLFATEASLHCAAMRPNVNGEIIQYGQMALGQAPGWGVSPELWALHD
jgi:hypothetical protein